jgi:hypothetical protein
MVSVLASSAVYRGFEPLSGQTKDYTIGICCFSAKHAALSRKSKDWLALLLLVDRPFKFKWAIQYRGTKCLGEKNLWKNNRGSA